MVTQLYVGKSCHGTEYKLNSIAYTSLYEWKQQHQARYPDIVKVAPELGSG